MVFTRRVTLFQKCRWRQWPCLEGLFDFHLGPPVSFKALFFQPFKATQQGVSALASLGKLFGKHASGVWPWPWTVTSARVHPLIPLSSPPLLYS